jgi:hypothetical protein
MTSILWWARVGAPTSAAALLGWVVGHALVYKLALRLGFGTHPSNPFTRAYSRRRQPCP